MATYWVHFMETDPVPNHTLCGQPYPTHRHDRFSEQDLDPGDNAPSCPACHVLHTSLNNADIPGGIVTSILYRVLLQIGPP